MRTAKQTYHSNTVIWEAVGDFSRPEGLKETQREGERQRERERRGD